MSKERVNQIKLNPKIPGSREIHEEKRGNRERKNIG